MTRYGVALQECVKPSYDATLRALDEFAERSAMPHLVPLWSHDWAVDPRLVSSIRDRGPEVVLYVFQTGGPIIDVDKLLRFADAVGDGTAVRLLWEPDGHWGAPWQAPSERWPQGWDPEAYVAHWQAADIVLRSAADIKLWWCPTSPRRAQEAGYWPGETTTAPRPDIVGFDRYAGDKPPAQLFAGPVRQLEALAPGSPIWVGETGIKAGESKRAAWLRSLADVQGVDVIVVMNLLAERPDGGSDDWRWTESMERAFAEMVA